MTRRKAVFAINWMEVEALTQARHDNPHHILGIHECIDDVFVNVYLPDAKVVKITDTEVFGEEVKRVTILDIEDEEVDEIYAEERE